MTARTKEHTRQLMLETGREILLERGIAEEISIRLSEVLSRLRLTTGAAYHIWANQDAYRRDLAKYCAEHTDWPCPADAAAVVEQTGNDSFEQAVVRVADEFFARFTSEQLYTRLYFWSIKDPNDELAAAARDGYASHDDLVSLIQTLLNSHKLQVIDGVTLSEIATTATAMVEGFSLRYRFEPERVRSDDGNLFSSSLLRYLTSVTEPA